MKRRLLPVLLSLSAVLTACPNNDAAVKEQQAAELAALKVRMTVVAQDAADKGLIGGPACVKLRAEGRSYSGEDADILPDAALWRFMEREGIAVRRITTRPDSQISTQFFVRDLYRDRYSDQNFCFGRWAIVDINPTPKGKSETRYGVTMFPFDVTLRLTRIRSQAWLESKLISDNLVAPINSISEDRKIRAYLPTSVNQLPPASVTKKLDQ